MSIRYLVIFAVLFVLGVINPDAHASRKISNYSWNNGPDDGCPRDKYYGVGHWNRWTEGCSTSLGEAASAIFEIEIPRVLERENSEVVDVDIEILDKYTTGPVSQHSNISDGHNIDVYQAVFEYQATVNGQQRQPVTEHHDILHRYYPTVNECRDEIGNPIALTTLSNLERVTDVDPANIWLC